MDQISLKFNIEVKKEYKNVSKYKRILQPVIYTNIGVFINDKKLDDVFVIDCFFDSLFKEDTYPMFTCTCGVFGCGGYYVKVTNSEVGMIWETQQSPFVDAPVEEVNKSFNFIFSWSNIINFAEDLILNLKKLNNLRIENKLDAIIDEIHVYEINVEKLKEKYEDNT